MDIAEIRKKAKEVKVGHDAAPPGPVNVSGSDSRDKETAERMALNVKLEQGPQADASAKLELKKGASQISETVQDDTAKEIRHDPSVDEGSPGSAKFQPQYEESANGGHDSAATDIQTGEENVTEVITFYLDDEEYAIDIHKIREVIRNRELTEVPRTAGNILGIISLRGVVIPILSLRRILGIPYKEAGERIVIVRDESGSVGLIVDNVKQVVRIPSRSMEPPPAINTLDGEVIRGIGRYKGGMFILLEIDRILEKM